MRSRLLCGSRGSAVVEVTLVLAGVLVLFLALVQVAMAGVTHLLLSGAAVDAARVAAVTRDAEQGQSRLDSVAGLVSLEHRHVFETHIEGVAVSEVQVVARVPMLLPWGPREIRVTRHSIIEP